MAGPEHPLGLAPLRERRRPPRRRGRKVLRGLLRVLAVLAVFALGLVLGDALGDRPGPPRELTQTGLVRQVVVTRTVSARTITVVVTRP